MLRRSPIEEQENHERWLVSYADFITLLFAFFVVMYSISQINEGKYRVMSESLESAFDMPARTSQPIPVGEVTRAITEGLDIDSDLDPQGEPLYVSDSALDEATKLVEIQEQVEEKLEALIDAGLVSVRQKDDWLEIDMKSGLLFQSGSARLNPTARVLIEELSSILADNQQLVRIRGYTDNIPISNESFASNWELSSSRAAHVVRILQGMGIEPRRMAVEGYSQFQPVDSNATATGRAKNRRVVLAISREAYRPAKVDSETEEATILEDVAETPPTSDPAIQPEPEYEIIRLESGGLLIRAKRDDAQEGDQ